MKAEVGEVYLTVGDLEAQETDKEEGSHVGEVIALEMEVLVEAHDGGILEDIVSHPPQ